MVWWTQSHYLSLPIGPLGIYFHGILIKTRTTRTPAFWGYPQPPRDYPYHWVILDPKSKEDKVKVTNLKNLPKFQIFEFWNAHYTRHTLWCCSIRCANMKWIRWVLLKIQSGHDSVHRRTDGQGDTSIPPFQLRWSRGYNNIFFFQENAAPVKQWPFCFCLMVPTHTSVNKAITGSDNGMSPVRCQANIWTNACLLLIEPLGTNFREIQNKI